MAISFYSYINKMIKLLCRLDQVCGELDCQRPQCSPPRCRNPVQQQGDCCPSCTECQYGGQTYQNLQRFTPSERPCLSCQCSKGKVTCEDKKLTCPPSSCSHPDTASGQCCPSCRGCFFMRRKFRNNQKFVPPGGDACKICLCRDGTVDCQDMGCPPLNCINPVKPPGHCCGTCPMACTVLGKTYNEGQMFDDPKDKCSVCMCTRSRTGNGEVRCQMRSCPQVTCSHPAQRPGECCPSCFMCRYNGQNILNGQNYIDPRQPCVECSCSYGIVTCTDKIGDCPPISCPYLETEPGSCCPVCKPKDCVINGVVFREGLTFTNPDDRCQDCQCDRGQPRCRTRSCPEVRCRYPSFTADKCCQECVDCSFNGLVYKNGISFDHPTERCQTCQCSNGEVQCRRKECPSVSCQYPVMAGCCPVCAGCQYQNKRYEDGQRFISAEDSCLQCTCTSGNIVKRRNPCPSVTCQHPVQGTCCQECNNCLYENRVYRNRQRFPDPSSQCNVCECRDGTVACTPRDCPLISCSNPASGACCPECSNCQYNGELVRNGGNVQSTDDPCKQCYCRNGNIECRAQTCVQTNCQYPVRRGCCQECSDCMYQGKEQRNNVMFPDPTENCNECLCRDGNVNCRRKSCPSVQCNSPVAGDCCPTCGDCYHKNVLYSDGAQFNDVSDPCMKCSCSNGNVRCARKDCNGRKCTHPVQGRCCPQCGGDCLFDGKRYDDGVTFKNRCEECTCTKGSVTCIPTRCLPVTCSHPVSDECCQVCTDCLYDRKRYRNSDRFQDPDDACQECYCQDGTVRCVKKQCPAVTCSDPVQGQCCPECTDCTYAGQFVRHGNTVADSKDPCSTCTCQFGSMICTRKTCAPASCDYPVTENQCGCQTCTGCDFRSGVYTNGERFRHPQDTCQQCTCQNGNVRCSRVTCRETCDHPANTTDCCPVCRDCFYEGKVQRNGLTFKSDVDPCRSCSCRSGNIVCETVICPVPRCDNPVTNRGECCPVCTVCQFHGGTFGDGQTFSNPRDKCQTCTCRAGRVRCDAVSCDVRCSHPRQGDCCPVCDDCMYEGRLIGNGDQYKPDPCNTCSCQSGNVGCLTQTCPRLTCPRTEKLPGQCCDVCLGCRYNGIYHSDGDAWTIDNNPCKTCACRGGIVTCMEMHCFSTCDNPINVPGQCCPVCPTCRHRDRVYSDGDMFSPSGDPCDLCECKGGRMTCHYVMCPATSNCPAEQIISPSVGKCCPTCSGGGQNCTRETYGMTILPKPSDPCVSCQCTSSLSWICRKEVCPLLNCPPAVQLKEDRECCPKCPPCHDTTTDRYYRVGDVWTDRDNLCLQCRCVDKAGSKSCRLIGCQALNCHADEREVKPPGECCKVCEEYPKTPCQYDGVRRQSGETWKKDACTTCKCYGDNVDCTKEQCIDPDCSPDYSLVTQPGQCCPVCVLQPGSCIVYGDPHYQTFDGNTVHFQGNCRYIMSEDCEGSGDFRVEVTHHDRGFSGISWAQNFTIVIGRTRIDLLQNFEVRVDGLPMNLPYKSRRDFTIDVKDQTILLDTTLGLQFVWNGESYAALTVPGTYKRQLCGLCGNFNGFDRDDMKTSSMQITNSPSVFGNSWKTKSQLNPRCRDAEDFDPCDAQIFRTRKYAQQQCSVLTGPKFSRCHRVVNPQSFFTSCVYDVCACGVEETCLCELLEAYVLECARNGVRLEWRSEGLCALDCEEEKGFVFDECGPVCPRDCSNYQTPISDMPEQCYKPCEASCQCPADKVLHEGRCINPTQCPPTNRGDIPVNGR
ncbi:kielin/chordin-like protein [Mytilus edulis]|uniref:kielin/chordin-like protein n=1 Tax=Mytilus edulis TaxID=6550 RepID=UPI0039EF0E65